MQPPLARLSLAASIVVVAGCAPTIEQRSVAGDSLGVAPSRARAEPGVADGPCVMEVPGTAVHVRDIDGGLAVTFDTVATQSVGPLRAAVRRFGDAYEHGHAGHHHAHATRAAAIARRFRQRNGSPPPLRALVRDVRGGASLELRASDPRQVELLRARLRAEIGIMQRGVCPLLDGPR